MIDALLDHWLGWMFLLLNVLLLFVVSHQSKNRYFITLFIIFFLHQVVCVSFAFFLPGDGDMLRLAPEILNQKILSFSLQDGFGNYALFLSLFYGINPSLLVGNELSITTFLFFCLFFIKIAEKWHFKKINFSLLLFALLPSVLIWTSIALRESYELCLLCGAVFYGLLWQEQQTKFHYLFLFLLLSVIAAFLHSAFYFVTPLILLIIIYWPFKLAFTIKNFLGIVAFGLCVVSFVLGMQLNMHSGNGELSQDNFMTVMNASTSGVTESAGSNYVSERGSFSAVDSHFVFFLLFKLLCFLCGPFPWQVNQLSTLGLMLVSWMRILLLYRSIQLYRYSVGDTKKASGLLLLIYGVSVFVWSAGVGNYGTAARHVMLSDWIIFMLGFQPNPKTGLKDNCRTLVERGM